MIVEMTSEFKKWFSELTDLQAKARIAIRIRRIEVDNFYGDHKSVGGKVFELRIQYGPGYRVYYRHEGDRIILMLNGGTKKTQDKDIRKAKIMK